MGLAGIPAVSAAKDGLGNQHIGHLALAVYGKGHKSANLDIFHSTGGLAAIGLRQILPWQTNKILCIL